MGTLLLWAALAAAPGWARDPLQVRHGELPVPNAWTLFETAVSEPAGDGERALLLCKVEVPPGHQWDTFGQTDLLVRVRLGKSGDYAQTDVLGPEDSPLAVASMSAKVAKGDRLRLDVFDRDVTGDEFIGEAEARFTGTWPLQFKTRNFDAECRGLGDERVEEERSATLHRADAAAAALTRAPAPDAEAYGLGFPDRELEEARRHVRLAARYAGWEDAEVQARVVRLDEAARDLRKAAGEAVRAAGATATAPGVWVALDGLELRITATECWPRGCEAKVEVRNPSKTDANLPTLTFATDAGMVIYAELSNPRPLAAGETRELTATARAADGKPLLVRAHGLRRTRLFSIGR